MFGKKDKKTQQEILAEMDELFSKWSTLIEDASDMEKDMAQRIKWQELNNNPINTMKDMNVVMDEKGRFIEIQGTAEGTPFDQEQLETMTTLAQKGIRELIDLQQQTRRAPDT